jgi:hypothetical protein
MTQSIVLVTGSDIGGPLGVLHLPRLWATSILTTAGLLADGVGDDPYGFDALLTHGLGIEPRAFRRFLATLPTYVQSETWVRAHAKRLDAATIERLNDAIRTAHDNGSSWDAFHAWLLDRCGAPLAPVVPAISSRSRGPLGVNHLARLWAKALIDALDALPEGFRTVRMRVLRAGGGLQREVAVGGLGGLDVPWLEEFGIDVDACAAYLREAMPTYRRFEEWVVENAALLDDERIAAYNARRIDARPEKAAQERAEVGLDEPDLLWAYMLNDLQDWKTLHDIASSAVR